MIKICSKSAGRCLVIVGVCLGVSFHASGQTSTRVNVFLGTSGDHGQLSPAASYPFSMMSIGPQTYPATHPGYEYYAKRFLGFTHNRMEGVGCQGNGGNILIRPFSGKDPEATPLIKKSQQGSPGYYGVTFENGIHAEFTVNKKLGVHKYRFIQSDNGFSIDLGYAFVGRFKEEKHDIKGNSISGFVRSGTTCSRGIYKIYYYMEFSGAIDFEEAGAHQVLARLPGNVKEAEIRIAFSSVDVAHAKASVNYRPFGQVREEARQSWDEQLDHIKVEGDKEREKLFYSLFYRTLQSPFVISEPDGAYRAIDGSLQKSANTFYNGWAIWDNYKTQLTLLSMAYPDVYKDMIWSVANMYLHGKKDFSTDHEPSQTVRTEHAVVVLLDAWRKGYHVNFKDIIDSLISENKRLDYSSPDKALESSYDTWALSEILQETGRGEMAHDYRQKALNYKKYWKKDFEDMSNSDVDRMGARGMYQGTVWQYRWMVPYDVRGLIELCGGEEAFIDQLDVFFEQDYYNHANEPDIQVPWLYHATSQPWKSDKLIRKIAIDTVHQFYFNGNSRGIDPFVGRIYKNQPKAFLRTMDDDAGAMSGWFVLAATGLSPACAGWPVYYVHVPLFRKVRLNTTSNTSLTIEVKNFDDDAFYVKEISLNGKKINRNWLTHEEISRGGVVEITASDQPFQYVTEKWVTEIE